MTDDTTELRVRLAERLDWKPDPVNGEGYWIPPGRNARPGGFYSEKPPSLRSLVEQAERGLGPHQQDQYAIEITALVLLSQPVKLSEHSRDVWIHLTPREATALITASDSDRAAALLKVL